MAIEPLAVAVDTERVLIPLTAREVSQTTVVTWRSPTAERDFVRWRLLETDLEEASFSLETVLGHFQFGAEQKMAVPVLASVAVVSRHYDAIGALDHVQRFISDCIDYSRCWTMARAAAGGHIALLRRLHAAQSKEDTLSIHDVERAMELAAQSGHLEVVQFLQINYPQRRKTWCLELAVSNGQLAVLKWLHEHGGDKDRLTMSAFDDAAENGHLEVVKWLHENRSEGCTTRAMDCAARSGRLDIVQWLHAHRQEGCTTQAMDWAAQAGHLEVAQWLHLNRREGCSTMAIDAAASNGHLHLVRWLHEHFHMACSCNAHAMATQRGHHHVLEWIGQTQQG